MLYGAGSLYVVSKDLGPTSLRGENILHPLSIASFELAFEDNNIEAKALIDNKRQVVASAIAESIATLTLTYEYMDWQTLGLAFADELATESVDLDWTSLRSVRAVADVPATPTKAVVADSAILGTEVVGTDIFVYISSQGSWGDRKYLEAADVTVAAGKLEIDKKYVGAVVQYTVKETYSSIETIGLETNYDTIGTLSFQGVVAGTEFDKGMGIIIPKLTRISTPSLTVNGDLAEMSVEYRAEVPTGKRRPYEFYNLSTAVV